MVRITVPDWIVHRADERSKRSTIYTLDVHPDGTRLATGGLDTKIRVWATAPIAKESARSPRLLSTLARHTGAVLCLRWSHSGRFLASGSDDTVALIWDLDESGSGSGLAFGTSETNIEHWRPHRRLPGHESDVTDVAWSESDAYLATVGLDSLVILWSGDKFERVRTIRGHHGFVKGVSFDPIDQFLATSSDDRTVKIWRTSDWGLEASIKAPFKSSPSSTFFHRPSWTPDGAHLLAANAMNGPVFVASIVNRYTWASDLALVGHENAVTVAACSPRLFEDANKAPISVVALGSQDQSVSVWMTGLARPLLVAKDLFERHVMDLAWSADGYTLYACSSDGSVAVLSFDAEDLAPTLPDSVLMEARAAHGYTSGARRAATHAPLKRPALEMDAPPPPLVLKMSSQPTERLKQTITRDRNGKRRIRPTMVNEGSLAPSVAAEPSATLDAMAPCVLSRPAVPLSRPVRASEPGAMPVQRRITWTGGQVTVEARNETDTTELAYLVQGQVRWTDMLASPVLSVTASSMWVAVSLHDGTLVWYSAKGRRRATMALDPCVCLASQGAYLSVLTTRSTVAVWHVVQGHQHIPFTEAPYGDIASMYVHTNGVPVLIAKQPQAALALDTQKRAFVCIAQAALARLSEAWDVRLRGRSASPRDPVLQAECALSEALPPEATASQTSATSQQRLSATLSHLDMRMAAAELLDSANEYRQALHALGRRLADEGLQIQAEDLVEMLLGPVYYQPAMPVWVPKILGMDKRELLVSLLALLSQGRLAALAQKVHEILRVQREARLIG
ncbi:HIR complex subunit [Malassezia equina]|uniref:Protein HIR n=1 Tax=Malassezia equina TaxID=1381935 RepID=A0AAF0J095_9BASI|nr:HIR complex subunit [Malassezia equina]